jgi:hypothetical protein
MDGDSRSGHHMDLLSTLLFRGYARDFRTPETSFEAISSELEEIFEMSEEELSELIELAETHHVMVRVLRVLERAACERGKNQVRERSEEALQRESARISNAVEWLHPIVGALADALSPVAVIKSLDHWPDLGSDLDLYTSGSQERVINVMQQKFRAKLESRSWGDKLANKWNFRLPGLKELVEIHVRYLGQTGEQKLMAERVVKRMEWQEIDGRNFPVPSPEERILISTLQRMYRHFYFRLCDMADMAALLASGRVNFDELRDGAEAGGIWPGVQSFLVIVSNYVTRFGGVLRLPPHAIDTAPSAELNVEFRATFLRVPKKPAAALYGSQLLTAGKHGDLRAISRLPLLPGLAVSALIAFRLTGNDKGVW